jgi:hypothetical protein
MPPVSTFHIRTGQRAIIGVVEQDALAADRVVRGQLGPQCRFLDGETQMRSPRGFERSQYRPELQQSDAERFEHAVDGPTHQFARQRNVAVHPVLRTGDLAVRLRQDVGRGALEQRQLFGPLSHRRDELDGARPGADDADTAAGQFVCMVPAG